MLVESLRAVFGSIHRTRLSPLVTDRAMEAWYLVSKAPPRLRKPSPDHDRCVAPTADLEAHRARLREAFGNTLSDEFVEVLLGKLMELLRPNPFDQTQCLLNTFTV
jgi:hypothetical protein